MDCNTLRKLGLGINIKRENRVECVTSPVRTTSKLYLGVSTAPTLAEFVKCVFSLIVSVNIWLKLKPLLRLCKLLALGVFRFNKAHSTSTELFATYSALGLMNGSSF